MVGHCYMPDIVAKMPLKPLQEWYELLYGGVTGHWQASREG